VKRETGEKVAIKEIHKQKFLEHGHKLKQLYRNEVEVLKKVKSSNVIAYIDDFESKYNCYLITEFCSKGDLHGYISSQKGKRIPEKEVINYFK
jgi:serine/threonine protein kinase